MGGWNTVFGHAADKFDAECIAIENDSLPRVVTTERNVMEFLDSAPIVSS